MRAHSGLLKVLARAFRWRWMPEDGRDASVSDIARAEKIDRTYAGDILRLTLLGPRVVEAIVERRQDAGMTLPVLMNTFPVEWAGQNWAPLVVPVRLPHQPAARAT
jgi:hypothetical protein